jgi:hypothetical protein
MKEGGEGRQNLMLICFSAISVLTNVNTTISNCTFTSNSISVQANVNSQLNFTDSVISDSVLRQGIRINVLNLLL